MKRPMHLKVNKLVAPKENEVVGYKRSMIEKCLHLVEAGRALFASHVEQPGRKPFENVNKNHSSVADYSSVVPTPSS